MRRTSGKKTHVEHSVRLVQDENLDLIEPNHSTLHLIEQTAGRRHENIRALTQRLVLPAVARAAEKNRRTQVGEAAVIVDGGLHLRGKLACRFENESPQWAVLAEARDDRQRKGGGFAGTRLGGADEVAPRHHNRDGA